MPKKSKETIVDTPFYQYLWSFYADHKKEIWREYKPLTRGILSRADYTDASAFLRKPQYEAFEMYVFLKEFLNTPKLGELFENWCNNRGNFRYERTPVLQNERQYKLFQYQDAESINPSVAQLKNMQQDYANYIFALTMGTGKTILMAVCIFYEFLLANKYPQDELYCHNALVLAPDTTVRESLREIMTFDKSKVFAPSYAKILDTKLRFHFLEGDGISLNTLDGSDFNIIIANSQKIILKRKNKADDAQTLLFKDDKYAEAVQNDPNADLYEIEDEKELTANQRYKKLSRLTQLGIYVDEAHHAFGKALANDMTDRKAKTSLRLTIDHLANELNQAGTKVVACYNYTGTPYADNRLMPEVVYAYGLKEAIDNHYLKEANIIDYNNVKSNEFVHAVVDEFLKKHRNKNGEFKRYENMLPKLAFFASTIDELQKDLRPALEKALMEAGISLDTILVNVGDDKLTKTDDLREFKLLDTPESTKQFILLVGKGKEGWNCRSLFGVSLFRKPDSTIFVLQATMRCLRSITTIQQTGQIFLSTENLSILQNELQENYRMSVDELRVKKSAEKKMRRIYVRKVVEVKVIEQIPEFKTTALHPQEYTIFDAQYDCRKYVKTKSEHSIRDVHGESEREILSAKEHRKFTRYSLIAELSMYLTQHIKNDDGTLNIRHSPTEIESLLERSSDGLDVILEKVNQNNDILYDYLIPKLFSLLYKVEYSDGEPREVTKYLVKHVPEEGGSSVSDPYFEFVFDDDKYISDDTKEYSKYNQSSTGNGKSFNLSGYGFDSMPELDFFRTNLFENEHIKHIWFTGMLTHGQSDFLVRYIDPESHALRSYYPDFLVEMDSGNFCIIEIKGENLIPDADTQAKAEYASRMFSGKHGMAYLFVPSHNAHSLLMEILSDEKSIQFGLEQNV